MRFTVLGDAHLWPVAWQRLPEARGDSFIAAKQVFDYAEKADLPVLASGDVFNFGQKGGVASCIDFLREQVLRVRSFSFIVGNHDLTGYTGGVVNRQWLDTLRSTSAEVLHLCQEPEAVEGVTVCGIDYCHGRTEFLERLNKVKEAKPDILVIHQGLKEILGYEGAWEVECADLDGVARAVICGHTHTCWEKKVGDTLVISPGSTVPWQMDEEINKQFPVVDMEEGTVDWIPVAQARDIQFLTVSDAKQQADALAKIEAFTPDETLPEDIRKPVFRIRYAEDAKFYERLALAAEGKVILDLTVDRANRSGSINFGSLEESPKDVDDVVVATHKHTSPGRVREAAVEIQRSKDPEGVIERHVNELLAAP
jgi:DNA repair exonuclease SbcCD nuclease subunit